MKTLLLIGTTKKGERAMPTTGIYDRDCGMVEDQLAEEEERVFQDKKYGGLVGVDRYQRDLFRQGFYDLCVVISGSHK